MCNQQNKKERERHLSTLFSIVLLINYKLSLSSIVKEENRIRKSEKINNIESTHYVFYPVMSTVLIIWEY